MATTTSYYGYAIISYIWLLWLFANKWTLDLFLIWGFHESCGSEKLIKFCMQTYVFILMGRCQRIKKGGSVSFGKCTFNFVKTVTLLSKVAIVFFIPTSSKGMKVPVIPQP